jgi:hypothetical protein
MRNFEPKSNASNQSSIQVGLQKWQTCLFGDSVLCNSTDTWCIGSTWCQHIDGYCQMSYNSIPHHGGTIVYIWKLTSSGCITAWNLGRVSFAPKHNNGQNALGRQT